MRPSPLSAQTVLFFRTFIYTTVPLHEALVTQLCEDGSIPVEFCSVLEDIGQRYMRLAETVGETLKQHGLLDREPEADDTDEAKIEAFIATLLRRAKPIAFRDGQAIDGHHAIMGLPAAVDGLKTAILLARNQHEVHP